MQKLKVEKGITLIALIITIIVMLILVGVTVNVALNGGLFNIAKNAASQTEIAMETEQLFSAAIRAMKSRGKVNFTNLDKNLPQGFSGAQGIYTSSGSEQTYKVSSDGTIKVIEPLEIVVGQYKTSTITIASITRLTDDEAAKIAGSALGIEADNLREFNEEYFKKLAEQEEIEMSYSDFTVALAQQLGKNEGDEASDQEVFKALFGEMGFETVQQVADYLIEMGLATYEPQIKLTINGDDKTDIYNSNGFEYPVEYGVEYTIDLQVDGKIATKTVKIEEDKPYNWDKNKVAIRTEGETIIPIPHGFEVSSETTEDSIDEGLVIKNGGNEFVWVPVNNPAYTEGGIGLLLGEDYFYEAQTDSYQTIQYYYGNTLGEMNSEEDFEETFTFIEDQENIERSIRTYGGFYVGRYETTYDNYSNGIPQSIGVKSGKPILHAGRKLKLGKCSSSGMLFYHRWWGLYVAQKNMYEANSNVGSLMITSGQWDEIMQHTNYGDVTRASSTYTKKPDLSGSVYKSTTDTYDKIKNIYDLAGNVAEFTMSSNNLLENKRLARGGDFDNTDKSANNSWNWWPSVDTSQAGSRVALYIK